MTVMEMRFIQNYYLFLKYFEGDRLLAVNCGGNDYNSPNDIKLNLKYPKAGVGAVVTFALVMVEQVIYWFWRKDCAFSKIRTTALACIFCIPKKIT